MPLELHILVEDNGRMTVQAPENPIQAYGLLEMAKDVVRMRVAQQQKIASPMPADIALLRGGRG